jgi:hypothetical protein
MYDNLLNASVLALIALFLAVLGVGSFLWPVFEVLFWIAIALIVFVVLRGAVIFMRRKANAAR